MAHWLKVHSPRNTQPGYSTCSCEANPYSALSIQCACARASATVPKQQLTDNIQHFRYHFMVILRSFRSSFWSFWGWFGGVWGGPGALGRLLGGMLGVTWLQDRVSEIFGTRRGGQGDPCWAQVGGMLRPSWDILGSKWASRGS